jgi:hypothetical protein
VIPLSVGSTTLPNVFEAASRLAFHFRAWADTPRLRSSVKAGTSV